MLTIDFDYVKAALPPRDPAGHEGDFGKVYVLGGSVGYTGAPVFCSAVGRCVPAAGLVFLGVPDEYLAGGGGEKRRGHALSRCRRLEGQAVPGWRRRLSGGVRRAATPIAAGLRSGPGRGRADALVRRLLDAGPAAGAGCRWHKRAGAAYG